MGPRLDLRWWARSLGVGALVGGAAGFVVGGLLGRAFMRILALAQEEALGLSTAMGAIVGLGLAAAAVGGALAISSAFVVQPLF
jgi:hypothetical protein